MNYTSLAPGARALAWLRLPSGTPARIGASLVLVAALASRPAAMPAQARDPDIIGRRAAQVVAMINGTPVQADTIFSPAFLAQVPDSSLQRIVARLAAQLGRIGSIAPLTRSATIGTFDVALPSGAPMVLTVTVEATSLHRVNGFFVKPPDPAAAHAAQAATIDALLPQFRALPGQVSLLIARIDGSQFVPVAAIDTGRAMALGSAFKLYVLAELIREVRAGTRHWNDIVLLDSASRSLPSGRLQEWPIGTPMTVQSLATLMISQSDNTAADRLLHLLGRENVERVQATVGNRHAELNVPFLSTREMFGLKSSAATGLATRYLAGDVTTRRAALRDIAALPYSEISYDRAAGRPFAIDSIEWFASAADLARTMIWLRDQTEGGPGMAARGVLAVNPGIAPEGEQWPYIGYKGGSETGVIDMTLLLRRADGTWFVLTATWNDPAQAVDDAQFAALVNRAALLLGRNPG